MTNKTKKDLFLQIRVSQAQKKLIGSAARRAGLDMSTYVLERIVPRPSLELQEIVDKLRNDSEASYVLAELSDFIFKLDKTEFERACLGLSLDQLSIFYRTYVASMLEVAAMQKNASLPEKILVVPALAKPYFGSDLKNLRLYLLTNSPAAFKKRNIFIDSSVGDRV